MNNRTKESVWQSSLQNISSRYRIRLLQETDMDDILRLSESNPMFYEYCPPFVTRESILNDMKALPQGKTDAEKYYIGFFEGQKLIAIMDMVFAFPDDETVYIGLFDLAKEYTVNLNYCNKLQMRLDVADYNGGTFGIGNIKVYK